MDYKEHGSKPKCYSLCFIINTNKLLQIELDGVVARLVVQRLGAPAQLCVLQPGADACF